MKNKLCIALIFSGLISGYTIATGQAEETAAKNFELDAEKALEYQEKQAIKDDANTTANTEEAQSSQPKIITEKTENGRIEKLLDEQGLVIAEKTIERDKIIKKVLNYYYPDGKLMRQITANEDSDKDGFYAEEYYGNGKISSQARFINEENKIGIEKKYDVNGVLRQEIPWVLPRTERDKPQEEQQTIRSGIIKTYYPAGQLAAEFPIDEKGITIFYDYRGFEIKRIENSDILSFSKELTEADCQGITIKLSLEELVELYEDEGDISYNKCGLPYRENFVYEVVKKYGARETKISYDETGMIRRITTYNYGKKDGTEKKYDASGNLTADINYKNGVKEGEAVGYFPTKEIAFRKNYKNGKVVDKLTCYFPTGEVAAEIPYTDGLKNGKAIINSPVKREIEFSQGNMVGVEESERQLKSNLTALSQTEQQCLNIDEHLADIKNRIQLENDQISKTFSIKVPEECKNIDTYKNENNNLVCYDLTGLQRVVLPIMYTRGDSVQASAYTDKNVLQYQIPYVNKMRQGWVQEYDDTGNVITEMYYNEDKPAESAHSYYSNGQVKEIMTIADDRPYKLLARYDENGALQFSVTYKDNDKTSAYIKDSQTGKDITVRYYKGALDDIRESDIRNPYTFTTYNLALNEYITYQNNLPTQGGKLCVPADTSIAEQKTTNSEGNNSVVTEGTLPEPPIIPATEAPIIEDANELPILSQEDVQQDAKNYLDNAVIPSEDEKKQAELAKRNIGPIAKPEISQLTDTVQKETVTTENKYSADENESKIEKIYYPNGNIRKSIKTKGSRTEEIKEYSKNGLLLTDITYDTDKIIIEKYFGSGQIRRKTEKNYDDNAVNAFMKRQDFYDNGKPRYEIERLPQTMLFKEKVYDMDGHLKSEIEQTAILAFNTKVYNKDGKLIRETKELGNNVLAKDYDSEQNIKNATLNGETIATNALSNEDILLSGKAQVFGYNGKLVSMIKKEEDKMKVAEYDTDGQLKTEILFYNNGEITFKAYNSERILSKFAYLAQDGKLHIEKPFSKIIPSYRERYWVDYNNPRWIENQDRYSIKSIGRLNLDVISNICMELDIQKPDIINKLYQRYN